MRQLLRHRVCRIDGATKDALSDLNFSVYIRFVFIKACMRPRVFFHPVCFHLRRLTRSYNMCCSVMYSSCLFCSKLRPFFMFSPVPTQSCQGREFDLKGGQSPCAEFHILVWVCVPFHEWISLPAFLCIAVLRGSHFIFNTVKTSGQNMQLL